MRVFGREPAVFRPGGVFASLVLVIAYAWNVLAQLSPEALIFCCCLLMRNCAEKKNPQDSLGTQKSWQNKISDYVPRIPANNVKQRDTMDVTIWVSSTGCATEGARRSKVRGSEGRHGIYNRKSGPPTTAKAQKNTSLLLPFPLGLTSPRALSLPLCTSALPATLSLSAAPSLPPNSHSHLQLARSPSLSLSLSRHFPSTRTTMFGCSCNKATG